MKYDGPPMDLKNMRQLGVHSLSVSCLKCHHEAVVNVDDQPEELSVPSFNGRMRCGKCGSRNVFVMPAWSTKPNTIPHPN